MLVKQQTTLIGQKSKYDTILDGGRYKTEWKVYARKEIFVSGSTSLLNMAFTESAGLISVDIDWGVFSDAVAVGCAQSRQIVVKLRTDEKIVNGELGVDLCGRIVDSDTGSASDWLYAGRFFISRRKQVGEILELTCYDSILKAQGDFFSNGEDMGEWPRKMKAVAADIASRIGCSLYIPSSLPDYDMEAPVGLTMRDVLSSMAAAWGGNWMVKGIGSVGSYDGFTKWTPSLRLLPLGESIGTYDAGKQAMAAATIGEAVAFTGVRMFWSDTDCFESGNCDDKPLEAYCEWATQEMTDNVWNAIRSKTFQAFEATNAWLHPAVEPGDSITINGFTSQIITMRGSMGAGCALDVAFPGEVADEDEYPYEGPVSKTLQKKVSLGKPYYGATISREQGLTIKRSDGASEAIMNSDVFSMRAKDANGQMIDCIYFDALAQLYRIRGQVEIDGSLVTQNLYADEGDIVSLTVDSLMTSRRIERYINRDESHDNYISIQDNRAKWISAKVKRGTVIEGVVINTNAALTEQVKNKDGQALYWTDDPSKAEVVNGHYEIDGKRVTTTTTNTGWPVTVYQYEEAQAMQLTFADDNTPLIQMGTGSTDRVLIMKRDGLQLDYTTEDGKQVYLKLDGSGRIICKDTLSSVDLSKLDTDESFTMNYNGQAVTYGFKKTATGYELTKPNGEGVVTFAT